jgi:hypothetical protein
MNDEILNNNEQIDHRTSRSICDAIGEQLQQDLRPELSRPSPRLQLMLDELHRRDGEDRLGSSN